MSYQTHSDIAHHGNIQNRVAACAATEGYADATRWAAANMLYLVKSDWISAWEYALAVNPDQDPGVDDAVITDGMILSAVQAGGG